MLKNNSFELRLMSKKAFQNLKLAIPHAPILSLPDFSKTFIVEGDASRVGVGVVLLQERPKVIFSQALHRSNLLLLTYEKEIFASVLIIQNRRLYLLGRQFIVRTNHQSLRHLWTQKITIMA